MAADGGFFFDRVQRCPPSTCGNYQNGVSRTGSAIAVVGRFGETDDRL